MSKILSKVSKFVPNSIAISFARSARDNCDPCCKLWDTCYAARIERIYVDLSDKLAKHYRAGPMYVLNRAIAEIQAKRSIAWCRLSVDGSLPPKSKFSSPKSWRIYVKRLRQLITLCQNKPGFKGWHIPVESLAKARTYRAALKGLGVVVRRTSQARTLAEVLRSTDHRAMVVGKIHNGCVTRAEKSANTELAFKFAKIARKRGQAAVVCPAIAGSSKCGKCTACEDKLVQIVFYPFHG